MSACTLSDQFNLPAFFFLLPLCAQVLSGCDTFLRTALSTPGLFRQEVEPSELSMLRTRVEAQFADRRKLDLSTLTRNVHATAALLRVYLQELPAPLLTFELYPFFLECGGSGGNAMTKLAQLADLLSRLPPSSFRTLALVLSLLFIAFVVLLVMLAM